MGRRKGSKNKVIDTPQLPEEQKPFCEVVKEKGIEAPVIEKPKPSGKGILLIALGNPQYGRMAANLAASIRFRDKDVNIHLVYQGDALNHLTTSHTALFSSFAECPQECYTKNCKEVYLKAKTCIYDLSPFETTIFLDVDLITFPTKTFEQLFDELKDVDFTMQNRGFKVLDENINADYSNWCNVKEVIEKYQTNGRFYQLASEFIYFKRNEANEKYFAKVKEIFDNPLVKATEFGEDIPDELAFDIASSVLNHYPHKDNFVVIYWGLIDKQMAWTDILNKYYGYSIGGNVIPETILVRYNQLALKHAQGLNLPYHYKAYNKKQWNKQRQTR